MKLAYPRLTIRIFSAVYRTIPVVFDPATKNINNSLFSNCVFIPCKFKTNLEGKLLPDVEYLTIQFLQKLSSLNNRQICLETAKDYCYYVDPNGDVEISDRSPYGGIKI